MFPLGLRMGVSVQQQPHNPADEEHSKQRPDDAEDPDVDCLVCRSEFASDPVQENDAFLEDVVGHFASFLELMKRERVALGLQIILPQKRQRHWGGTE